MRGTLYLVGTPIGNLGDITLRAIETLKTVSRVYAEDTRRTRTLLNQLGIEGKKLLSLHAHSPAKTLDTAVSILEGGDDVALVTDAGMPSVSDPGTELVRAARNADVNVTVVPGPSAVTSAVTASGLVSSAFCFQGFLPRKGTKRRDVLQQIGQSSVPTVLFESPHRIADTLVDLARACGPETRIAICRELTKRFEEVTVVPLERFVEHGAEEQEQREWLGELTLVVAASESKKSDQPPIDIDTRAARLLAEGASVKDAAQKISRELGDRGIKAKRRDLYARVQRVLDDTDPGPEDS